jgi:Sulfatase
VLVVRSRLALRLVLPLVAVAVAAVVAVLLVSGGSGGRVETAQAQPIVDPQGTPAKVPAKPYVVLIVLDEFPGDALLDAQGQIDPIRYPNIAALAANGTWYRNAWSTYDSTTKAVPLILDGLRPRPGTGPTYLDHPHSIFELLGRRGYRIQTSQEAESMCAPSWCPGSSARTPAIVPNLQGGRPGRFERFVRSIRPGRPTFWFKHALLPHKPYLYLPSGHTTRRVGSSDPMPGMDTVPGFYDEFLTHHNEQRFLLQLAYTDRLLGQLFDRLKSQGMFDKTLVAVTADHGLAWQVGVPTRRSVDDRNVEEIAPVPLIVKAPGQRHGRVDDALVSTLDVTPTLADVLGWRLPYRADGKPASSRAVQGRRTLRLPNREFTQTIVISGRRWKARRAAVVQRRLRQLGSGEQSMFTGIGPNRQLIGKPVADEETVAASSVRATVARGSAYRAVRRASGIVPTQVAGALRGARRGTKRDLALAINGTIVVVGHSFYLKGDRVERFALNVPEDALPDGRNEVALYEVVGGDRLRLLTRV